MLAPTIFLVGLSGVFGEAARLPGFEATDFRTFIVPVGLLQGAAFTGAATGVNLARDIERGWFDRLMVCPAPRDDDPAGDRGQRGAARAAAGHASCWRSRSRSASTSRVSARWRSMRCWSWAWRPRSPSTPCSIALRFKTQQAAPLMQTIGFIAVLFTTAYAPMDLLAGWMRAIATINPVTQVLEGVRQGFVANVTWAETWPALAAMAGLLFVLGALAVRMLGRVGV